MLLQSQLFIYKIVFKTEKKIILSKAFFPAEYYFY